MNQFLDKNPRFFIHTTLVACWLLFLGAIQHYNEISIKLILPFLVPVVLMAWRYGPGWGFMCAAFATLAAMPGDYMQSHDMQDVYWAVFTTYLKLTVAAAGIVLGRHLVARRNEH